VRSGTTATARTGLQGNLAGFAACVALLGYAYYSQYALGLEPCPLCILQRIAVLATGLAFFGAALHRAGHGGSVAWGLLIALCAALGAAMAGRHVWIIAQPPGAVAECGASLDYMLDVLPLREVLQKVLTGSGECAKVSWRFLGISMPAWVLASLVALGAWGLYVNLRRR
jgi:protein dithiol:quinone oxidoreductase